MLKSLSLSAIGASLLPSADAVETHETKVTGGDGESSSWADQGWLLLLAGLVCLLHIIKDLGWELAKRLLGQRDHLKVKLLDDKPLLGIALECPTGCCGRIAPRSSLALRGIDIGGGVIDPDFRGEVKVILVNNGNEPFTINPGDRIGQLVLEKFQKTEIMCSGSLSNTQRGFGSSGVAAKHLSKSCSEPREDFIAEHQEGVEAVEEKVTCS